MIRGFLIVFIVYYQSLNINLLSKPSRRKEIRSHLVTPGKVFNYQFDSTIRYTQCLLESSNEIAGFTRRGKQYHPVNRKWLAVEAVQQGKSPQRMAYDCMNIVVLADKFFDQ